MSWTRFARRRHAPVSARLLQEAQRAPYFEEATGIRTGLTNHAWIADTIYIPTVEQNALQNAVATGLDDEWMLVAAFCGHCETGLKLLTAAADALGKAGAHLSAESLGAWFDAYRYAMAFVPAFRTLDRALSQRVTAEEAETYLQETGLGQTEEEAERDALQQIAETLRAAADHKAMSALADDLLRTHADEFGWIRPRWYLGEPFSAEDFRARVAGLLMLPPASSAPAAAASSTESPNTRSRLLAELAHLRTSRAEVINKAIWTVRPRLTRLAEKLGVGYVDLVHLYHYEILEAVQEGHVNPTRSRARQSEFATALVDGTFTEAAGADEVAALVERLGIFKNDLVPVSQATSSVLQGVAASPGTAHGPVRVVHSDADADQLQVGEVLVTTMTYPSMVGAMQRAAAIVTDDGGLLSHAAVTARELAKPCVIDTGNATLRLSTGTWVLVDADHATVTIVPNP